MPAPATTSPPPTDEHAHEVLRWADVGVATDAIAANVRADGFRADVVIGIARGGLVVGGALAYALGVKRCGSVNVELYTGIDETLPEPLVLPPHLDGASLAGQRVLVADDVSQTGVTLRLVVDSLTAVGADVRTACYYTKPGTALVPDWWWRETDRWIDFPWSS